MDLIASFINKNLEDFVKSFSACSTTAQVTNEDIHEESNDEYLSVHSSHSEPDSHAHHNNYLQVNELKECSPQCLSHNSFLSGVSFIESVASDQDEEHEDEQMKQTHCNETHDAKENEQHNHDAKKPSSDKIYGQYAPTQFDLCLDVNVNEVRIDNKERMKEMEMESEMEKEEEEEEESEHHDRDEQEKQWTDLPNVVNVDANKSIADNTKNARHSVTHPVHDTFLSDIAKEIAKLDEELSSMGILTADNSMIISKANSNHQDNDNQHTNKTETICSSDMEHDEEEKMDILHRKPTDGHSSITKERENQSDDMERNEEPQRNSMKEKLSLLRNSMVLKKKPSDQVHSDENGNRNETEQHHDLLPSASRNVFHSESVSIVSASKENQDTSNRNEIQFESQRHKDAFFDPLVSPPRKLSDRTIHIHEQQQADEEEQSEQQAVSEHDYNQAVLHENASKIQKQWKKFQFKTLLVKTFNRHLRQSQDNNLPVTVLDLIASTTHEIVDHAEKLFSAVHAAENHPTDDHSKCNNTVIGNFSYGQLHFYGSPALDWTAVYSMIESIVLRNLLYYKYQRVVQQIMENQKALDDIVASYTRSNADNVLIDQLSAKIIQLKTKLYQHCQHKIDCHELDPLRLFPANLNIFRARPFAVSAYQSPVESTKTASKDVRKPELDEIKHKLKLLRQSFSQRNRNRKRMRSSIASSPQLSASLRSSILQVNGQITTLCAESSSQPSRTADGNATDHGHESNDTSSPKVFTFDSRPMTAPTSTSHHSYPSYSSLQSHPDPYNKHPRKVRKKPYLKRRKNPAPIPRKVDWSHVEAKTVSHLSDNVRATRMANSQRAHYKPNVVDFRRNASSRVDCKWSNKHKQRKKKAIRPSSNMSSKHNHKRSNHEERNENAKRKSKEENDYLYYFIGNQSDNKIGKISRDSASAQLQEGYGPMILQTKQKQRKHDVSSMNRIVDPDNSEVHQEEDHNENALKELQHAFAAIESAMKQRRSSSMNQ